MNSKAVAVALFITIASVIAIPIDVRAAHNINVWGPGWDENRMVPAGLTNVVALASGERHTLALTTQGTVIAWGDNEYGQTNVPPNLTNVIAIAAGDFHSLALKADHTVTAWGENRARQTNVPGSLTNVVAIAAGSYHSLALCSNGTVTAWGSPLNGEIAVPENLSNAVAIAAGSVCSFALKGDGRVVGWGGKHFKTPVVPDGLTNVVSLHYRHGCGLALKTDGRVVTWGSFHLTDPIQIPRDWTNIVAITGGNGFIAALRAGGRIAVWNPSGYSSVDDAHGQTNCTTITAGSNSLIGLTGDGLPHFTVYPGNQLAYSGNKVILSAKAVGTGTLSYQWRHNGTNVPKATNSALIFERVKLSHSGSYTLLVSNRLGRIVSPTVQLSIVDSPPILIKQPTNQVAFLGKKVIFKAEVDGSQPFHCQWRFNGTNLWAQTNQVLALHSVTYENAGQYSFMVTNAFGTAATTNVSLRVIPMAVWGQSSEFPGTVSNIVAIAAGNGEGTHALALTAEGTVIGWGNNHNYGGEWAGQATVPEGLSNVVSIACGGYHSLALHANGHITIWGDNSWHQTEMPSDLTNIIAVSGGAVHSLALRANGTVVAWGANPFGETNVPPGLSNVVSISAGVYACLALCGDGKVVGWGMPTYRTAEIPPGLTNVVAIDLASYSAVALRRDGTVAAWGWDKSITNLPPNLTNVVALSAGAQHCLALKRDGTVQVWGSAAWGGTNVPPDLTNVVAISAAECASMALVRRQPGAQPIRFEQYRHEAGRFSAYVPTQLGKEIGLEYKDNVSPTQQWYMLPRISGDGSMRVLTDSSPRSTQRIYRAIQR